MASEGLQIDKQLDVGDGSGNRLTASYWRVEEYMGDRTDRRVRITVKGWRTEADYDAGLPPVKKQFQFTVSEKFDAYFDKSVIGQSNTTVISTAYDYLLSETNEFVNATLVT